MSTESCCFDKNQRCPHHNNDLWTLQTSLETYQTLRSRVSCGGCRKHTKVAMGRGIINILLVTNIQVHDGIVAIFTVFTLWASFPFDAPQMGYFLIASDVNMCTCLSGQCSLHLMKRALVHLSFCHNIPVHL